MRGSVCMCVRVCAYVNVGGEGRRGVSVDKRRYLLEWKEGVCVERDGGRTGGGRGRGMSFQGSL